MYSSLVVLARTATNIKEEDYTKIAEQAGVKFLKLNHTSGITDLDYAIGGFQCVHVAINKNYQTGRTSYSHQPSRDKDGNDCDGLRNLVFRPDKETGELEAYLPDTPFNRTVLASTYGKDGCEWILSKSNPQEVIAEITRRGEECLAQEKENKKTENVLSKLAEENAAKEAEIAELKRKLEEANSEKKVLRNYKQGQIKVKKSEEAQSTSSDSVSASVIFNTTE